MIGVEWVAIEIVEGFAPKLILDLGRTPFLRVDQCFEDLPLVHEQRFVCQLSVLAIQIQPRRSCRTYPIKRRKAYPRALALIYLNIMLVRRVKVTKSRISEKD